MLYNVKPRNGARNHMKGNEKFKRALFLIKQNNSPKGQTTLAKNAGITSDFERLRPELSKTSHM